MRRLPIMVCACIGFGFLAASLVPALDVFTNFAHILMAGFLMLLVVVTLRRRSLFTITMAAVAFAGPAALVAPEAIAAFTAHKQDAAGRPQLKVMASNVWTRNIKYELFTELIEAEQPEIVFLQESFEGWRIVIDRLAPRYRVAAGCYWPHECNAVVLTRLEKAGDSTPYLSSHVMARLQLPQNMGGGKIEAISIHLSRPPPIELQLEETRQIEQLAGQLSKLAVMGGDFNATPWSSTIRRLDRSLRLRRISRLMPSWPSVAPIAPVDHIYVGEAWDVVDVRRGPDIGSDHRPIIATLVRRPAATSAQRTPQ